ncbi:peptidase family M3 domain-containing protein [Theileria equi strain WA]|uniref:Peptidase family M3 domain-containing protein n=1 Tax=Theileria equi strain WA TaxID=1537102 RepID=L0B036_THEEQ|nr:peptidase family M3 domain-containing protein [Theileria equi strain WA]AFZ80863.1 peptidase family M3 domain-containing protein [Theileria equi strain WA]|eukprot:XP_004830529.1 peptidase family M3 domain-containing protein [Theileria equi strain WA]
MLPSRSRCLLRYLQKCRALPEFWPTPCDSSRLNDDSKGTYGYSGSFAGLSGDLSSLRHRYARDSSGYTRRYGSVAQEKTLFGLLATSPSDLLKLSNLVIKESQDAIDKLLVDVNPSGIVSKRVLTVIDDISNSLCLIADPSELLRHVHPSEEWRMAANSSVENISGFIGVVNINEKIYKILTDNYSKDLEKLTEEENLVLKHMINSMKHQGVGLPQEQRDEYLRLQQEEFTLSFELSDTKSLKLESTVAPNGNVIPPDPQLFIHILRNSDNEELRTRVWYAQRCSNEESLAKLLRLQNVRTELAKIRGFDSFASCALRECILSTPNQVNTFLCNLYSTIEDKLNAEIKELQELVGHGRHLMPWDVDFLISKVKDDSKVSINIATILEYFKRLMSRLFNVDIVKTNESLWDNLVAKYDIVDSSGPIAHLYLDLFERPNKINTCAQFTIRCSKWNAYSNSGLEQWNADLSEIYPKIMKESALFSKDGILRQIPATVVVCSFHNSAQGKTPEESYMESKVDLIAGQTLFHELGHTVHALLSETKFQHLAGNRGSVDFAEFSSHLFEIFYAKGVEEMLNIEGLGEDVLCKAKVHLYKFQAIEAARMIFASLLDQKFYGEAVYDLKYWLEMERGFSFQPFEKPSDKRKLGKGQKFIEVKSWELLGVPALTNFEHLIHYGGNYFCYLYSRILAGKVWNSFSGLDDAEIGKRLRNFFKNGSIDASLAPLSKLSGVDLHTLPEELFIQP